MLSVADMDGAQGVNKSQPPTSTSFFYFNFSILKPPKQHSKKISAVVELHLVKDAAITQNVYRERPAIADPAQIRMG